MSLLPRRIEAMVQYILFTLLVIATPFVVVTKFLQGAVYTVSHLSFPLFGFRLPILGTVLVLLFLSFLIWQRKNITPRRLAGALIVIIMIAFGQWVQDFYCGMAVYDLQRNWHYAAYAAYIFMFFRTFHMRGLSLSKLILFSFISAVCLSTIDEFFQFHMSDRVFDVSDIAKDSWGAMMGLGLVLFVSETYGTIKFDRCSIFQRKVQGYIKDPLAVLTMVGLFSFIVLTISPLLTEYQYIGIFLLVVLGCFILTMLVIHLCRSPILRWGFLISAGLIVILLTGSVLIHRDENVRFIGGNLIVYKGLPVPFFDILIHTNGMPRLVDKKEIFNKQDQKLLLDHEPDILLIGSGSEGQGGKGFQIVEGTSFVYNQETRAGMQVIVQRSLNACETFNRLKRQGKRVLLVWHNS